LLFIIILILINNYFFKKSKKQEEKIVIKKVILKEKTDYNKLLNEIEKRYIDSDPEVFYSHISEIIRLILDEKEKKNISNMTFDEINRLNINIKIKDLIKKIYFKEYAKDIDDNKNIRTQFI